MQVDTWSLFQSTWAAAALGKPADLAPPRIFVSTARNDIYSPLFSSSPVVTLSVPQLQIKRLQPLYGYSTYKRHRPHSIFTVVQNLTVRWNVRSVASWWILLRKLAIVAALSMTPRPSFVKWALTLTLSKRFGRSFKTWYVYVHSIPLVATWLVHTYPGNHGQWILQKRDTTRRTDLVGKCQAKS